MTDPVDNQSPAMARDVRGRAANGFVSAVLLVVLLATTGWPTEPAQYLTENDRVISCEGGRAASVGRAIERLEQAARPTNAAVCVALPRVLPRQRRVDSGGLPPPRAPTS